MEAGLYVGGFISNYYHQFYDAMKWPGMTRPELDRVSPELGARYAYFPQRYLGIEGEASLIAAGTQAPGADTAKIYGLRAQVIGQLPGRVTPFVGAGIGLAHTSSDTLGSDTDWPIHVGAGVRFYATPTIALRADIRFLRGPSEQAPYTLNASYGEFGVGVSWIPGVTEPPRPPPPPEVVTPPPPADRDGDGILDTADRCPLEPETVNGWEDDDGCPDVVPDSDGDGIDDLHDKCKDEPEDKDGWEDDDGCPDPDNDGDGVPDAKDRCVSVAGPADNGGCPDTDKDSDGLVDRLDNCPEEAGPIANRGCKTKQIVTITRTQLELAQKLGFDGAKPNAAARKALDAVVRVMLVHSTDIWLVEVVVYDPKRADERAAAIVAYLAGKGIAPERLRATGKTDAPARVELNIVAE
jgi:outer membrane protein with beta-barrel domain/thrombospondin type 3 repeat protein